jgi:hypothetical protein
MNMIIIKEKKVTLQTHEKSIPSIPPKSKRSQDLKGEKEMKKIGH